MELRRAGIPAVPNLPVDPGDANAIVPCCPYDSRAVGSVAIVIIGVIGIEYGIVSHHIAIPVDHVGLKVGVPAAPVVAFVRCRDADKAEGSLLRVGWRGQ